MATLEFTEKKDTKWSIQVHANFADGGAVFVDGTNKTFTATASAPGDNACGEAAGTDLTVKDHTMTTGKHTVTIYGRNKVETCNKVLTVKFKRGSDDYKVASPDNIKDALGGKVGSVNE